MIGHDYSTHVHTRETRPTTMKQSLFPEVGRTSYPNGRYTNPGHLSGHKRSTFRSLLSSLINRTSGEREKNGKTGRKLWGQGEGYYRGRRRVVM